MNATTALALLLCAAPAFVLAASNDELRSQLEQRLRLVERLIDDAPGTQRIAASGDAAALSHLDEGRLHRARAREALAHGNLDTARRAVDEALHHLGLARRRAPDTQARHAAARLRHEQVLAHLDRLVESWQRRLPAADADAAAGDGLLDAIGRIDRARVLGREGRFDEAQQILALAETQVLAGLTRLLGARELDYTPRASTPAEELQMELLRHDELAELLPLALRELRPRGDALAQVERYRDASQALRAQALDRARNGERAQALADIHNASLYLQRALGATGLPLPQGALP